MGVALAKVIYQILDE